MRSLTRDWYQKYATILDTYPILYVSELGHSNVVPHPNFRRLKCHWYSQMSSVKSVHSTQLGAIKFDCLKPESTWTSQGRSGHRRFRARCSQGRAPRWRTHKQGRSAPAFSPASKRRSCRLDDRSPLGPQSLTINPAGKLSFDGIQGEDAWEALAEQVAAAHRQGDTRYLRAVPMQTKEAVLCSAMEQLDAVDRVDRSAAFTVLYAMSSSLPKSSAFTPSSERLIAPCLRQPKMRPTCGLVST